MIIKNLDKVELGHIIKDEDFKLIESGDRYYSQIKKISDELLEKTQVEVEDLKKDTYQEVSNKIIEENKLHLMEFNQNLEKFLNDMSEDIYSVIYKILIKFGYDKFDGENLKSIILDELSSGNNHNRVIKIKANHDSINKIKKDNKLQKVIEKIDWEECDSFIDGECICSTNLWTM